MDKRPSSAVDDPSALHAILHTAAVVARFLWRLLWAAVLHRTVAVPLALLAWPLSFLVAVLRLLFAPALHVIAYVLSWARAVVALIAALEPLYTFFSVAAAIGIVSGIAVGLSSSVINTCLGMYDDPEPDDRPSDKLAGYDKGLPVPDAASWKPIGTGQSHLRPGFDNRRDCCRKRYTRKTTRIHSAIMCEPLYR